jgi:predicted TIM-barrel fold metal-dependent hydrolase
MGPEISELPVTDIHCFSFAPSKRHTMSSLSKLFMAGGPTVMSVSRRVEENGLQETIAYRRMIHWLAGMLGTKDDDLSVLSKRNSKARDFPGYLRQLFDDARIEGMALDNGLEPISFGEFRKYAPGRLYRVYRIEPLLKRLLESTRTFEALFGSFDEAIRSAVKKEGFAGFKTVIAYRTGLDISAPDEDEARRSFRAYRRGDERMEWFGPRVKPVRDFLLSHVAERARGLGSFLQIHTGLGDTDIVPEKCDPLLLKRFLSQDRVSKVAVVLIHGGFPYTAGAAWLANVFPNVYFELSSPLPPYFLPALSKSRFMEVLEMVPTTRIVYGSDGHDFPEMHWLSAKLAKQALTEAMKQLIEERTLDEHEASRASRRILGENARRLLK